MKSLLELISKYSSENSIMPIIALAAIILVIVLYVLVKPKWVKYTVTFIIVIIGSVMMFSGYKNMLETAGLNMIINATKVLTFGIVGFLFALILGIIDSLAKIFKRDKKKQKLEKKEDTVRNPEINHTVNDSTRVIDMKDDSTKVIDMSDDSTKVIDMSDERDTKIHRDDETKQVVFTDKELNQIEDETQIVDLRKIRNTKSEDK